MARHILISIAHLIAIPGFLLIALPAALLRFVPDAQLFEPELLLWPGIALLGIAAGLAIWMGVAFVVRGQGTPNPAAPPRRLVTHGLYRFVRNPGYVAVAIFMAGEILLLGSALLLAYTFVVMAGLHTLVVQWEEPGLRRRFEAEYLRYCEHVPRWWPRAAPWSPPC